MLFEAIRLEQGKIIESASAFNANLIPIIAMAVKEQYDSEDEFLGVVVRNLLDYGGQFVTMGETFESVEVKTKGEYEGHFIFITRCSGLLNMKKSSH